MAPKATKTALSKAPGSKLAQNLQRVSPGVYRNAAGQLTNSGGRPMPGQASRVPSPSVGAIEGAARGAGAAMGGGRGPMPQGGGMRPPMGGRGGVLEGVAQGVGAGLGANMGGRGGMRQPANPNFQQQFEDMRRGFEVTDREMGGMYDQMRELGYGPQQPGGLANGAAQGFAQGFGGGQPTGIISDEQARSIGQNFGGGFGDMQGQANGFAQGFGRGFGGGMGGQQPSLEQQARSRAEAIARGDMVTMDYNPQREEMVNQFLGQMGRGPAMNPQMKQPGTVSGTLQRGPMQRPNPFASMIGKKPMPL